MSAVSLVCAVPRFQGLSTWLSEIRQRLDPEFLPKMTLALGFAGRFQRFTEQVHSTLLSENPALSYDACIDLLRALPEETCLEMAYRAIAASADPPLSSTEVKALLAEPGELEEHLSQAHLGDAAALNYLSDAPRELGE
jgi:hypothetical protein